MSKVRLVGWTLAVLAIASMAHAGIIINEVNYQAGTEATKWVELYNPDPVPQQVTNLDLVFIDITS